MPLFCDDGTSGGLGQEPSGLQPQLPNAGDPAKLACIDPQILEVNFDFGPFNDNDLSSPSDASAMDDCVLSANPGFTALSPSLLPSWFNDPYPPTLLQRGSSQEPGTYSTRTGKSYKRVESGSIPTTDKATSEQGATPRKRGRKPRIKTEEEKERQLQRQRQRNRLAATRCRSKKKGETQELEQNAERLRERRDSLRSTLDGLSSEVLDLKEAVIKHRYCGSGEVEAYIQHQFHQLVEASLESSSTSQNTTPELVSDDLVLSPLDSPRLSTGSP